MPSPEVERKLNKNFDEFTQVDEQRPFETDVNELVAENLMLIHE